MHHSQVLGIPFTKGSGRISLLGNSVACGNSLGSMKCQAGAKQSVSYLSLRAPRVDRWWGGMHGAGWR